MPTSWKAVKRYHRVLQEILQEDPPVVEGTVNELKPGVLRFLAQQDRLNRGLRCLHDPDAVVIPTEPYALYAEEIALCIGHLGDQGRLPKTSMASRARSIPASARRWVPAT
jgi:hypothetical protein